MFFAHLTSAGNVRIVAVVLALAGERVGIVRARWWGEMGVIWVEFDFRICIDGHCGKGYGKQFKELDLSTS